MSYEYDSIFFDFVDQSSGRSASEFLPRIQQEISPKTILDVGCGRGIWLAEWKKLGVESVLGIDGNYVDVDALHIDTSEFLSKDITEDFFLNQQFDLVECLEVAEHLPKDSADTLINNLTRHGNIILFSAAQPGQGGEQHINEQPALYWMEKFKDRGFEAFDYPRWQVKGVDQIEPWYRYNTVLYVNQAGLGVLSQNVLDTKITSDISSQYMSIGWKMRCLILRCLPQVVIHTLAKIKHHYLRMTHKYEH